MSKRNSFKLQQTEPFQLSRSKIDLFLQCPRCFYLDRKCGVSQPSGAPFTLNNAVDTLLKSEFDSYRKAQEHHPFVRDLGINAIPYCHPELDNWRNNRVGIRYLHPQTNFLLYGAIDDVWQLENGELVIVDYKAKATTGDITLEPKRKKDGTIIRTDLYLLGYKRQMEFYQWLFRMNGFHVSYKGYFVFANALKDRERFNNRLDFDIRLIPYDGDDSWVEPTLIAIKTCLTSAYLPSPSESCAFCQYNNAIAYYLTTIGCPS